jgi:hypothetical protein
MFNAQSLRTSPLAYNTANASVGVTATLRLHFDGTG